MTDDPTTDLDALRTEVGAWLADERSASLPERERLERVVDRGYAVPTWPRSIRLTCVPGPAVATAT